MFGFLFLIIVLVLLFSWRPWGSRGYWHDHHWHTNGGNPPPYWSPPTVPGQKTSLRTLDERYARGEIEREDYLQRKQDLQGN